MLDTAIGVIWPIIVLNANEVIPPTLTPFRRMAVPNNSAGIAQDSGPFGFQQVSVILSQSLQTFQPHLRLI